MGSSSQGQASDQEVTNRLTTLEKLRASDLASLKRLNASQMEMSQKLDDLQEGMDTLALECSQEKGANNAVCAEELATINGRLDSIVSSLEKNREKVCPRPCHCDNNQRQDQSNGSAAAPAAVHQPSRSTMATKGAAPAGGPHNPAQPMGSGYHGASAADDATRRRLDLSDDTESSTSQPPERPRIKGLEQPHLAWLPNTNGQQQQSSRTAQATALDNLVMVSERPVDYDPGVVVETRQPIDGLYCPSIGDPKRANDAHFRDVCDYRYYRLQDTSPRLSDYETRNLSRLRKDLDNGFRIPTFSGEPPIALLSFLRQYTNAMRDRGHSEALAARLVSHYLEGEAASVVEAKVESWDLMLRPYHGTWPSLVQALIMRFLKDEVLKEAAQEILHSKQKTDENEQQFASRLTMLVAKAGHVFNDGEKAQLLLDGVPDAVGQVVRGQLKLRPPKDIENFELVEELVTQEGQAHRARIEQMRSVFRTPKGSKLMLVNEHEKEPVMAVSAYKTPDIGPGRLVPHSYGTEERPSIGPITPYKRNEYTPGENLVPPSSGQWRPMAINSNTRINDDEAGLSFTLSDACDVVQTLDQVLTVAGVPTIETSTLDTDIDQPIEAQQISDIRTLPIPKMSPREVEQAMQVVPEDYWGLNCWACRTDGHSMYKCPLLLPAQRLYFAYRYYLHQIQANSQMREYLADRMRMRRERREQVTDGTLPPSGKTRYPMRNPQSSRGYDMSYQGDGQRRNNFRDDRGQGGNRVPHKPWARENSPAQGRRPNIRFNSSDRVHVITPDEKEQANEVSAVTILRRPSNGDTSREQASHRSTDIASSSSEENV